jgi:hypothetical protein
MPTKAKIMNYTDEDKTTAINLAIGAASACWDDEGVFRSEDALTIAQELEEYLDTLAEPNLGLATTGRLLDELRVRIQLDYYAGGGGLGYTTVAGKSEVSDAIGQVGVTGNATGSHLHFEVSDDSRASG